MKDKIWTTILDSYDYPERPCDTECKETCDGRTDCPLYFAWMQRTAEDLEEVEKTSQKIKPADTEVSAGLPLLQKAIAENPLNKDSLFPNMGDPVDKLKRIKEQFAKDVCDKKVFAYPDAICRNQPPQITNLMNGCLSCPLRNTCKILFVDKD